MYPIHRPIISLFLVCLSIAVPAWGDHAVDERDAVLNMRIAGLSGAYTAVADDYNALFLNPAGLGMLRNSTLGVSLHYRDVLAEPYLNNPSLKPEFYYAGPGWGAGISSTYHLSRQEDDTYRIQKVNNADLGFGLRMGMFSLGVSVHASKVDAVSGVELEDPSSQDFLMDFLTQVFLNTYDSGDQSSESVLLRGGILFDSGIFSAGAYHSSLFDIMAWSEHQELPSLKDLIGGLDVGISLRNPRLNRFGVRNILRIRGALDVMNIGMEDTRTLKAGVEAGIHLSDSARFVLRGGYSQRMVNLMDMITLSLTPSEGSISLGAGLDLVLLSIQAAAEMPATVFANDEGNLRFGLSAGFTF